MSTATAGQTHLSRSVIDHGLDIGSGRSLGMHALKGLPTSIEVFAGYLQQNYTDGNSKQVSQPTFGITGFWNPIREVSVRPFLQRTVTTLEPKHAELAVGCRAVEACVAETQRVLVTF